MKNKRYVAMLLAALLTASALPMAAPVDASEPPSATIEIGENLLDGVTPEFSTAAVSMDAADAGNGFLQVKRADTWGSGDTRWRGLAYTFNSSIETSKTYFLSFRMRTTTAPVNTVSASDSSTVNGQKYTMVRIIGNVDHSTTKSTKNAWSVKAAGANNRLAYLNNAGLDGIFINDEWNTYVIALDNVTKTSTNAFISFCGGTGNNYAESFEIDDFKLYTTADNKFDSTPSFLTADCYDFSLAPTIKTDSSSVKGAFQPIWQDNFASGSKSSIYYVNRDSGYNRIPANSSKDTYVKYNLNDIVLTPGTYRLEAELRRGDWQLSGVNKSNITTAIDFEGTAYDESFVTNNVYINWTNVSKSITISEPTKLSEISFTTVGEKNTLDVGKVTFKLVSPILDTNTDLGSSTTLATTDLLNGAAVTFGDSAVKNVPINSGNGYLSLAPRTNGDAQELLHINLNVKPDTNTSYYVSFDIRSSVLLGNTSNRVTTDLFRIRVLSNVDNKERAAAGYTANYIVPTENSTIVVDKDPNGNNRYCRIPLDGEWAHFEGKFTPSGTADSLKIQINRGTSAECLPIDIDNFKVWTDSSKIISENFNDSEKTYAGSTTDFGKIYSPIAGRQLIWDVQDEYVRVTPGTGKNPTVTYDFTNVGTDYTEGVYFFDAELRAGKYMFDYWPYTGLNDNHEVTVTFNLKDIDDTDGTQDKVESLTKDLTVMWTQMQLPMIVPVGYKLTGINITTNYTDLPLDIKNVTLSSDQFPIVDAEDSDEVNYLDGVTMQTENTAPVAVTNNDTAYLAVGERTNGSEHNILVIKLNTAMSADQKYYVSMKMRGTEGESTMIRPKFDLDLNNATRLIKEALPQDQGGNLVVEGNNYAMNAEYIVPTQATMDAGVSKWESMAVSELVPLTYITPEWTTFEGYFTPVEDVPANKSQIVFNRGNNSNYTQPFEIDELVIWKEVGGNRVVVYENDFEADADLNGISSSVAKLSRVTPVNGYLYLEPFNADEAMTITYDLGHLTDEQLVEGKYSFKAQVRTETDAEAKATVTFCYDDGTTDTHYITFGKEWSCIGISERLGRTPDLKTIKISIESDVAVRLTDPVLNIQYRWQYGRPNVGIVMVLMKKLQGKMIAPKLTEFLPFGDFETMPPTIHNSAIAKTQTAADEGFWAKQAAGHATTLEVETEDDNTFIRVNNVDSSGRGVWYNTGVTLEPGEYTFSVDLRVSETSESKNYTAYTWHNAEKDWQYMRTILQDPDQMSLGHYGLFNPVDKKTAMNNDGYVTGYQSKITREWTTYTDTIVIEKPTVIIFKIGGGTSGQPDSHGFDIDNVSLKGYVLADESQG